MARTRTIKPENLRSEAFMMELFGVKTETLRKMAKEYHFITARVTTKVWLYDITDAVKVFDKFAVQE